jgi:hypothetical protein
MTKIFTFAARRGEHRSKPTSLVGVEKRSRNTAADGKIKSLKPMEALAGVEPTTLSLGRRCSIQLSYRAIRQLSVVKYYNDITTLYRVYLTNETVSIRIC